MVFSLVSTLRLGTTSKYISKDFSCFFRLRSHRVSPITIYRLHQKDPGKRAGQNLTSTQPHLCMYLCMYLDTQNKKTLPPSRLRPDGRKDVCTYTHKCDFSLSLSLSLSLFCTKQSIYYTYKKKVIDEQFSSRIYLLTDVVLTPHRFFNTYVYMHTYLSAPLRKHKVCKFTCHLLQITHELIEIYLVWDPIE